jgi:hypothetical protein
LGAAKLVYENTERFGGFLPDWQGHLRLAFRSEPANGGEQSYLLRDGRWEPWRFVPFEDSMGSAPIYFNRAGTHLSAVSSVGRDTTALIRIEMATGAEELLAAHPSADITNAIHDPLTREIAAVAVAPIRQEWTILDPDVGETLALAQQASPEDEIHQLSVSADNRKWVVTSHGPRRPATYLLIDRDKQTLTELFTARPELKSYRLAGMQGAGSGLLSGPCRRASWSRGPPRHCRWFFWSHGGPWGRDEYGYRRDHQWLANRGYAVLSVNYRASTGFGKAFVNAATGNMRQKCTTISSTRWNGRFAKGSPGATGSRSWAGPTGGMRRSSAPRSRRSLLLRCAGRGNNRPRHTHGE